MRKAQVLTIIFRKNETDYEYLLLRRIPEKGGFWQPPSGGVEDSDKSKLDCAYREVFEEAGIPKSKVIRVIDNVHSFFVSKHYITGKPAAPIEESVVAFEVKKDAAVDITKNVYPEHDEYRWVNYDEALNLLKWQNNKDAFIKLKKILDSARLTSS
jgi:dATP pyrophosphohydrolase